MDQKANQQPTLTEVLKRIIKSHNICTDMTENMNSALGNIQYLSIALIFLAENNNGSPELIEQLRNDIKFASTIQQTEVKQLNDKIVGYLDDFVEFVTSNEELKNLLRNR